jgi:hypothetical protein
LGLSEPTDCELYSADANCDNQVTAADANCIFNAALNGADRQERNELVNECCTQQITSTSHAKTIHLFKSDLLKVENITTKQAENFIVPISLHTSNQIVSLTFDIIYDHQKLEYLDYSIDNTLIENFVLTGVNEIEPGRIRIAAAAVTATSITTSGDLINLMFKSKESFLGTTKIDITNVKDDIASFFTESGDIHVILADNSTPLILTPTVTPAQKTTPIPTFTPVPDYKPTWFFSFNNDSDFSSISGGLTNPPYPGGDVYMGEIPKGEDGLGAMFILAPGQVELLMFPELEVGDNPAFIRASVQASSGGASIGLAALDGQMDGSIATNIPVDSSIFKDRYHWMYVLYKSPSDSIVPIFQVSNLNGKQPVVVYLDTIEIYQLEGDQGIPFTLLHD